MKLRSLFIVALAVLTTAAAVAESVSFTKPTTLTVMGKAHSATVTYTLDRADADDESLSVTVHAFAYGERSMGAFTFAAHRQQDGTYSAPKQVVPSERGGKPISVTVTGAQIAPSAEQVTVAFKPGKMPFAIVLRTR